MLSRSQFFFFFAAVASAACAVSIFDSTFNNFLSDTFHLAANARGWLELPREAPGFLVVLLTGLLAAAPVARLGLVGALVMVSGLIGLASFGGHFTPMILAMLITSTGFHLLIPVVSTIALTVTHESRRGRRLGQVGLIETLGMILGAGSIWLFFDRAAPPYRLGFLCGAGLAVLSALAFASLRLPHLHQPRTRLNPAVTGAPT